MRTTFFFFAMFASVATSATVTVTPLSTDYATKKVTFKVEWTNTPAAPYNNRVWVWVDLCPVTGTSPGTFAQAVISNPSATAGNVVTVSGNTRGFYVTTNPSTVTATLSNATGNFNWCVYGSDYPPNATITSTGYLLKGSSPFTITYNNGSSTVISNNTFDLGCINTLTDATGCPGLVETLSAPTSSTNGSRCNSGTVNISATPPSGSTIDWYTTASGTTKVTNGTGVTTLTTPSISTTTNYYAASRHLITGCVSPSRRTVTATVTNSSGRDAAPNSCGCASGLTAVGSYCRDLVADNASTFTGCGVEVSNTIITETIYAMSCPSGWRFPTHTEMKCIFNNRSMLGMNYTSTDEMVFKFTAESTTNCGVRAGGCWSTTSNAYSMFFGGRWCHKAYSVTMGDCVQNATTDGGCGKCVR